MPKKMQIHVITLALSLPLSENQISEVREFYVRHETPVKARNWLLENAVSERVATQEDVMLMVKRGIAPMGPFEAGQEVDSAQSRFDMEPPTNED